MTTALFQNLIMNIKYFIFKHIEKLVLGIAICYLAYTAVHTFIIPSIEAHKTNSKLLSLSRVTLIIGLDIESSFLINELELKVLSVLIILMPSITNGISDLRISCNRNLMRSACNSTWMVIGITV